MIGSHEGDNIHNEAPSSEGNDADNVDVAIADALKAQKNRQTVLRFEEDVLDFFSSGEAAHYFPLSLSGYQRLLAHRVAQYHGLQTVTVDDGGDHHGKIQATKPHSEVQSRQPKLADVKFPDNPEDHKEQPKSLKKKNGDRQNRRDRDVQGTGEALRQTSSFRSREQKEQAYEAARQRLNLASPSANSSGHMGMMANPFSMTSQGVDASGKAIYRNRHEDLRDPDYQRSARPYGAGMEGDRHKAIPGYYNEQMAGYPGMMMPQHYSQMEAGALQMMQNMSLVHPGEQRGYMQPGLAGSMGLQGVPYGYIPGAHSMPQAIPHQGMQAMGLYNHMPYSYPMAQPYPFIPGRPGQQQMMMSPGIPFYPGPIPAQGHSYPQMYSHPGAYPPRPTRNFPGAANVSPLSSSAGGSGGAAHTHRRAPPSNSDRHARVSSSSSLGSTSNSQILQSDKASEVTTVRQQNAVTRS